MTSNTRVLVALGAGLAAGVALQRFDPEFASRASDVLAPVGSLWVNGLLMLVFPLVLASLIVGVAGAADLGAIGQLGRKVALYFLVIVMASTAFSIAVVPPMMGRLHVDAGAAAALRAHAEGTSLAGVNEVQTAGQWIASLLPANPVRAAADGRLLPLVIFALLFALALTRLPRLRAAPVVDLCAGVVDGLRVLVTWILALAPIGVFALSLPIAVRFGVLAAGLIGYYLVVLSGLCAIAGLAVFLFARVVAGVPIRDFIRAVAPAFMVGFVTRSSIAALPAMMDGARTRLGLPERVTAFVLPLAVSAFKYCSPIAFLTGSFFLARLYGVEIPPAKLPFIFVQATLLSFAVPGILGGSVVTMAPILVSLQIPVEGLGLLLAVDIVGDMMRSSVNAMSDVAVAAAVARGEIPSS